MKRFILLPIFIFVLLNVSEAQNYWVRGAGGSNVDEALDVTKDSSGNFISVGYFTNTASFDGGTTLLSASPGTPDIFIQKISATGNLLWAVKAGGDGSDRATAVKCDANGDIYITGFYNGSATFGSTTLTAVNSSQDIFIAKLSSSGNFVWAISAGGSLGDYSYALALDLNNNVFITGEFEGMSTFGTQTFTSETNPQTNLPSFDIFTAKYSSSGSFLWAKQGKAEYNDRGMDLVCDTSGNVYVTGQFSDTITFQNTYNNSVMNAIFVLKYDASGQMIWFKRAAGNYGIGYAIGISNDQHLYVTGDYKGTLTFFGSPNNFLSDTLSNRIFLAKYSLNGNFVWAKSDASRNSLSSKALAIGSNGDIYLAGEFGCKMTEYSALYGSAIFNSIGFTDIFTCKYTSSGNRVWERHFGGPMRDKAHGIVEGDNARPILAGSFEKNMGWALNASSTNVFPSFPNNNTIGTAYCSDAEYGTYTSIKGNGLSNAFVCDAIDLSRQPYDFYERIGTSCDRDPLGICITNYQSAPCIDTIKLCRPDTIDINLHQLNRTILSPLYHINWVGTFAADTNFRSIASSTGIRSVELTSYDGCYSFQDSVYVYIDPVEPTITDDHGANLNQLPLAHLVATCYPDSVILTAGSNPSGNYTFQWSGPSSTIIDSVSINTTNSGVYHINLSTTNGCVKYNRVIVNFAQHIAPYELMPDTFEVCKGDTFEYHLLDSTLSPSGVLGCYECYCYAGHNWSVSDTALHALTTDCNMTTAFQPNVTGTYIITDTIITYLSGCAETVIFTDTIYVIVNPLPPLSLSVTGDDLICKGDTSVIIATTTSPVTWSNGAQGDTIYATDAGLFWAHISFTDSITGCYNHKEAVLQVNVKQEPFINTFPSTALICPNDSVKMEVDLPNVPSYVWHGPMGIISANQQAIAINVPGLYHCIATDAEGCVLTSNTIEIKQYSTPYLIGQPISILCPGETTDIIVMSDETATIQWQSPFSGDALAQTIDSGGVYMCNVTSCNITTNCAIEIIQAAPNANFSVTGATHFCPGDSVVFAADTNMVSFNWNPTGNSDASYHVYYPGAYWLSVVDAYGCSSSSDSVVVTWDTSVVAPTAMGDTICIGGTAMLTANIGSGPLEWYPSFPSSALLSSNDTFLVSGIDTSAVYYVTTQNTVGCHSYWIPVHVEVYQSTFIPQITSDTIACAGAAIQLTTTTISGATYLWSGPLGFTSTAQNPSIQNADTSNVGTYTLVINGGGCSSLPTQTEIDLIQALPISVTGTTIVCQNDSSELILHAQHQPVQFVSLSSSGSTSALTDSIYILPSLPGSYPLQFMENYFGCYGPVNTVQVTIKPNPVLAGITNNLPVCSGDSLLLSTTLLSNTNYSWQGPHAFSSNNVENIFANSDTTLSGTYTVFAEMNGCYSDTLSSAIIVFPKVDIYLGNDTTICVKDQFALDPGANYAGYNWSNGSSSQTIPVTASGIYFVTVTNSFGCFDRDTINIEVIDCDPTFTNVFTPNGDGVNDVFKFGGDDLKQVECTILDRWGQEIYSWTGPEGSWDGSNKFKLDVPAGTYYYMGTLTDYKGRVSELKGFISLER